MEAINCSTLLLLHHFYVLNSIFKCKWLNACGSVTSYFRVTSDEWLEKEAILIIGECLQAQLAYFQSCPKCNNFYILQKELNFK